MAVFKYKAISKNGAEVSGVVEAYDEYEAVSKIKENCSIVNSVTEVPSLPNTGKELFGPKKIPDKDLSLLSSQFSIILKTGLSLVRAVELIAQQTNNKQLKELLLKVADDVSSGYGLAQSLENKGSDVLPNTFIETVRAGEESGTLDKSFDKLADYFDKSAKIKNKVRSALAYPAFLLVLAAIVIAIVMIVAMPAFTDLFKDFDIEMPALTKATIALSDFMAAYWWLLALIIAAIVIGLKLYGRTEKGALNYAKLALKAPIIGNMNRMKAASQFANTMSTLLSAGIPLVQSVKITAKTLDNTLLRLEVGAIVPLLEAGNRLGEELKKRQLMPDMLSEMTIMGENTGSLERTLNTIGIYYDAETLTASERALNRLQPAITIAMGIIIGTLVISLYLPMFAMFAGL